MVFFKSTSGVLQINSFSHNLGLGSQLKEGYHNATSIPCVHLVIDLTPKTIYPLKYSTNSGSVLPTFFLQQEQKQSVLTMNIPCVSILQFCK